MDHVIADRRALTAAIDACVASIDGQLKSPLRRRLDSAVGLQAHGRATLERISGSLAAPLEELDEPDLDPRACRVALSGLRRGLRLLRALDHALELLRRPEAELGLGVLYLLADLASDMLDSSVDLVESPWDAPEFAVRIQPFRMLISGVAPTSPVPMELHYPRRQASTAALAPLLVHELGHPVCQQHGLVDELFSALDGEPKWTEIEREYAESLGLASDGRPMPRSAARDSMATLLEECVCDALATACLGPSYFLAFAAWAGLDTAEDWSDSHPPASMRMSLMVSQLKEEGWDLDYIEPICRWAIESASALKDPAPRADTLRRRALDEAAPAVRALALNRANEWAVATSPSAYAKHVEAGLEQFFDQDVLPAQLDHHGTHADRACILNAAWKFALLVSFDEDPGSSAPVRVQRERAEPEHLVHAINDGRANSFLDKALEMSAVLQEWSVTT